MMSVGISSRIERFASVNGISYSEAASILGKRGAAKREADARRKKRAQINKERFEKMKEARPDLW